MHTGINITFYLFTIFVGLIVNRKIFISYLPCFLATFVLPRLLFTFPIPFISDGPR